MNIDELEFKIGSHVVVEVAGVVKVRQETERGWKYIVQPYDSRASAIHAEPQFVFPPDDSADAGAEVIPFPRHPLPSVLAEMVEADVA